jgi:hypothetical protein
VHIEHRWTIGTCLPFDIRVGVAQNRINPDCGRGQMGHCG